MKLNVETDVSVISNGITDLKIPLVKPKRFSFRQSNFKYVALFLMCMLTFGRYYAYDNPQALETEITTTLNITKLDYNLLYTVYSLPNIILPFVGGIITDFLGVRFCIVLFSTLIILGQSLVSFGGYTDSFILILIGRILFGLGGENIGVVQSKIICKWFKNNQVAFAISFAKSLSRAGSMSNSFFTPKLYIGGLGFPFLVSDLVCLFALISGLFLVFMDKKSDKAEGIVDTRKRSTENTVQLGDLKKFKLTYWIILFDCMAMYGSINGFLNVGEAYIESRFGWNVIPAGNFLALFYGISVIGTPVFGFLADKFGRRGKMMVFANFLLIIGHASIILLPDCEDCYTVLIPICIMGIFMSMYAATFWGCIPLVVEKKTLGTAFGLAFSMQNFSWALLPLAVGKIQESLGYSWISIFLLIIASVGTIVALIAEFIDKISGSHLDDVYKESEQINETECFGNIANKEKHENKSEEHENSE